jgi:hypothetical protein
MIYLNIILVWISKYDTSLLGPRGSDVMVHAYIDHEAIVSCSTSAKSRICRLKQTTANVEDISGV